MPITPPPKRSRRLIAWLDPFVFDNIDEFQENDENPVIRPVVKGKNSRSRLGQTSSTINLTVNKENEPARPPADGLPMTAYKSSDCPEMKSLAEAPKNEQPSCLQCSTYKKKIVQLKKNVQSLQKDAMLSKQSYETKLRNFKHDNNLRESEYLQQIDELQDRCLRLISDNSFA